MKTLIRAIGFLLLPAFCWAGYQTTFNACTGCSDYVGTTTTSLSTQAILLQSTLQSGATFYTSSGTVTNFNAGTITTRKPIQEGDSNNSVAYGINAFLNGTGVNDTCFGFACMNSSVTGSNDTGGGYSACSLLGSGAGDTCFGSQALSSISSSNDQTAFGASALFSSDANGNTALGSQAGYGVLGSTRTTTGTNNTFLGYNTTQGAATQLTNAAAIGANAVVLTSNTIQMGGTGANAASVNMSTFTASSGTISSPANVNALTVNSSENAASIMSVAGTFNCTEASGNAGSACHAVNAIAVSSAGEQSGMGVYTFTTGNGISYGVAGQAAGTGANTAGYFGAINGTTNHGINLGAGDFSLNGAAGTSGQFIVSQGPNVLPIWVSLGQVFFSSSTASVSTTSGNWDPIAISSFTVSLSKSTNRWLYASAGGWGITTAAGTGELTVFRDGTNLGDASFGLQESNNKNVDIPYTISVLDKPGDTNPHTYIMKIKTGSVGNTVLSPDNTASQYNLIELVQP